MNNQPTTMQTIGNQLSKLPETFNTANIKESVSTGMNNVTDTINSVKENVSNTLNEFSSKSVVNASSDFLQSNSIIARFAFIILVLIGFMFLLNLGVMLIGYFTQPGNNPYIVQGTLNGNSAGIVSQDPKNSDSILIKRSDNQTSGIEYTWSVWLHINELPIDNKFNHIFNKGDRLNKDSNGVFMNNGPGLYLKKDSDNITGVLRVFMDTVVMKETNDTTYDENTYVDIKNIPLKKWFNVTIRVQNKVLDVYVNGTISNRLIFNSVPKQNYYDINLCQNGGFSGTMSNLRYFSYALSIFEINTIVLGGPNLKPGKITSNITNISDPTFSYLSSIWYIPNRNSSV
jgi:hypothetical protein